MKKLLLLLVFAPVLSQAQSKKQKKAMEEVRKADEKILNNIKSHIVYFSSDSLEGRRTGSEGEAKAMQYISEQFRQVGLQPKGTTGYTQQFTYNEGKKIGKGCSVQIDGKALDPNKEFIPLAFSPNKSVKGSAAITFRESGEPWFADIKEWIETNKSNPHYDINEALLKESQKVAAKGATALIVYNTGDGVDNVMFDGKGTSAESKIPVVYITKTGLTKYFSDKSATLDININIELQQSNITGHNVIGYLDNHAPQTIIIGAHYDHLGWGDDGNALDTGRAIHNGADDNASGTAAVIELARLLSTSKSKNNNYLFIAFSGEELGLIGSKYWLEQSSSSIGPINYMINMDMIGRYSADHKLTIGGYGTSPSWSTVLSNVADKNIVVKFDSTGSGPSDHAAFYRKNIPVLFFFTGTHSDYHKATDDWNKINYNSETGIIRYVQRVIEGADNLGKLQFAKTSEPQMGTMSQFTVTLGVIPDYSFSGPGLRIDGVSPKKLAEKIGMQSGDIITRLGDYKVSEINSYMQALSSFKKGDKTMIRYLRGKDEKSAELEF